MLLLMQVTPEMVDAFFQRVPQELELPPRAGRVTGKIVAMKGTLCATYR